MTATLAYAIKFVGNMGEAVRFHSEPLGLKLRFQSLEWSEFDTGPTTLALHLASAEHPAGSCQLGFLVPGVVAFYADRLANGVAGMQAPVDLHGQKVAKMRDPDGAEFSVGGR